MEPAEARAWVALKMVRGIGSVLGLSLVRAFGSPAAIFAESSHALQCAGVRRDLARALRRFDKWADADAQLERARAVGARLVTWRDAEYPERLRQIHDPPLFLFVKGALQAQDGLAVAVVGSRAASTYGRVMTRTISEGLARSGLTIVSGLARGVDAEAHAAALRAGGRTIAVMGCGVDVVYPSEHHRLHMQIAQHGAVVSELLMRARPDGENFPARNRIISGLALGTLVVEAAENSGSLITAHCAAEQGREVFAVPGPVGAQSRGTHKLLRQGAALVERAEDIIAEIAPQILAAHRAAPAPPVDEEAAHVLAALDATGTHVDQVIARTGLPAPRVLSILLDLELSALAQQLPGSCYAPGAGPSGEA